MPAPIYKIFSNITKLIINHLLDSNIDYVINLLEYCKNLEYIDIFLKNITEQKILNDIFLKINNLTNLRTLKLQNFQEKIGNSLDKLVNLETLYLDHYNYDDELDMQRMKFLPNLTNLKYLHLPNAIIKRKKILYKYGLNIYNDKNNPLAHLINLEHLELRLDNFQVYLNDFVVYKKVDVFNFFKNMSNLKSIKFYYEQNNDNLYRAIKYYINLENDTIDIQGQFY